MRYSVVLPRVEPNDGAEARRALDHAHALWEKGEQRAALDRVRQAAEAANAGGQKVRAMALGRAVTMLARAIGSSSVRPPLISDTPPVSAARVRVNGDATGSAATEPPSEIVTQAALLRQTVPAKPGRPYFSDREQPAPAPAPVSVTPVVRVSTSPGMPAPPVSLPVPPVTVSHVPDQPAPPAPAPAVSTPPSLDSLEATELIVTIAPSDWGLASPNALVGHRAQRVAVAPGRGPGGTLMVRPLAPGEVAPKGSIVAVMVALEPDSLPLSRAG